MDAKIFAVLQKSISPILLILKVLTPIILERGWRGTGEVGELGAVPPQPGSAPCR